MEQLKLEVGQFFYKSRMITIPIENDLESVLVVERYQIVEIINDKYKFLTSDGSYGWCSRHLHNAFLTAEEAVNHQIELAENNIYKCVSAVNGAERWLNVVKESPRKYLY